MALVYNKDQTLPLAAVDDRTRTFFANHGGTAYRPSRIKTPATIASRGSKVPMAGIEMLKTCTKPVTISQMLNKSIPRFLVTFMLFTSSRH